MCVCMCVCVCSNIFSETTGPTEAKFHVEPTWDRGRKFFLNGSGGGPDHFVVLHYCHPRRGKGCGGF